FLRRGSSVREFGRRLGRDGAWFEAVSGAGGGDRQRYKGLAMKLNNKLAYVLGVVEGSDNPLTSQSYVVDEDLATQVNGLFTADLAGFNKLVRDANVPAVELPPGKYLGRDGVWFEAVSGAGGGDRQRYKGWAGGLQQA